MTGERHRTANQFLSGWAAYAALAALALAAFAGNPPREFVFDDQGGIQENPSVNGELPFAAIFTHDFWGRDAAHSVRTYRPVIVAFFRMVWSLGAGTPTGFRTAALILHVAFVFSAFAVLKRIVSPWSAFLAAAMQSVCTASSEAILSHVANADILCAIAAVLGLAMFRSSKPLASLGVMGAFLLAIGSKESGLLAPVAWIAFEWFIPSGVSFRERVVKLAGCAVVAIPYFLGRHAAMGAWLVPAAGDGLHNPLAALPAPERILGAGKVFADRYLLGLLLPQRRTHDCSANACGPAEWSEPVAWLGMALWVLLCVAPLLLRKRSPAAAAGLAWFAIFFVPGSNFVIAGPTIYGERLLYIPALGLFLAIAVLLTALANRPPHPSIAYGAAAIAISGNVLADRTRVIDWQSDENITVSAMEYAPRSALMISNLALVAKSKEDYATEERYAREAIAIYPHRMQAHAELAGALFMMGRMDEAAKEFETADSLGNKDELLVFDYANFLAKEGEFRKAVSIVEEYLAQHPSEPRLLALNKKLKRAWEAKTK